MAQHMEFGRPGFLLVMQTVKGLVNVEMEPCSLFTDSTSGRGWRHDSTRSLTKWLRGDMYVNSSQIVRKVTYSTAKSIEYTQTKLLFAFGAGEYVSESSALCSLPPSWS